MTISTLLAQAYTNALYHYWFAGSWHRLHCGDEMGALALPPAIHACAFITAMNPRSQLLSEQENQTRKRQLVAWLIQRQQRYLPARAADPMGVWPREYGVLWLNPTADLVQAALRQFDQHAALASWGGRFELLARCVEARAE